MRKLKRLTMTLALLITAVTGAVAQTETLLTTITPTAKEQASYSTANVATVSFSNLPSTDTSTYGSDYLANWGWWGYGWSATVNAAEGYTITKCIFYDDQNRTATDSEAPFVVETEKEDKTPRVNGNPIKADQSKGIKKIEVYGYKSEPTEWSLTPDETGKNWTLDKMPASNVELQVEYYAESNLFLSKNALADKANIAVTAGELGVQFGNDGKSANPITEGTAMTVKYNGTKKVIGVKAEKKEAVPVTSITLNKTETEIKVGSTETLSVTAVAPDNATDKTYTWKTNDATKATVTAEGVVTAVAEGTVTIYAEANDGSGVKGNCTVTVTSAVPEYYNKLTKINDSYNDQVYLLKQLGRGRQAYNSSLTAAQAYALATYQAAIDGKPVYVIMSSQDGGYSIHYALSTDAAATEHTADLYIICNESNPVRMYYVAQ